MMEPERILNGLSDELQRAIKQLSEAKTLEEKVALSGVVKNLSESLGVFLNLATDITGFEEFEDFEDMDDFS